jgi:hypothetical protein
MWECLFQLNQQIYFQISKLKSNFKFKLSLNQLDSE